MRVLVTGGCGFIGHHLVNQLMLNGHRIVVLDDCSGVGAEERLKSKLPGVKVIRQPITCTAVWEASQLLGAIDVIYHLAAVSRTTPAIEKPYECLQANVGGSTIILEYARQKKVPRVVMSSSNVVYAADTPYKASKLMMEEACKAYHTTYGVSVICLRYSNVYGPGFAKGDPACLAAMRDSLVDRGFLEITGDGEQTRDFTHVDDIVQGNIIAAQSDYCGTVDLCTGLNVSMNRASEYIHATMPKNVKPFLGWEKHIPDRQGDFRHIIQDPKPARDILGWYAGIQFVDRVKDVWNY